MKTSKTIAGMLASMVFCATFSGCTEPGETTGIGAATGGVIGAGLGAIVGNQTGSPGAGLAVGALAGASAGAAVGNALQAQQEAIRSQDEAIERQEQVMQAQRGEIEELRRIDHDGSSGKKGGLRRDGATNDHREARAANVQRVPWPGPGVDKMDAETLRKNNREGNRASPTFSRRMSSQPESHSMASRDLGQDISEPKASFGLEKKSASKPSAVDSGGEEVVSEASFSIAEPDLESGDCGKAQTEIKNAQGVSDSSQKLFHYRRALRLCPANSSYHNGLGEIYLSMGRSEDAVYEFKEALRINPNFEPAKSNIAAMQ